MKKSLIFFLITILVLSCRDKKTEKFDGLSPQAALQTFQIPPGFKIELVAAEPLISDPVAMDLDEAGNMYVVELHGYPLDTAGSGLIKLLTDSDGDGMPDKSSVFASHLRLPTGIMRWKKGFLVVDVPDLLYVEDTDHDGKADIKTILLTGLALTNPQHIANTPIYGLDNWIYLAHMGTYTPKVSLMFNDSGNDVRFVSNNSNPLPRNANGRNIRIRPDDYELEMCSGQSQYGQTFDNWGHHFCVENADHIFEEVISARYLKRNPDLLIGDASDHISDHGSACKVFPITTNPENQLLTDLGVITSACGITWYNGGLFPDSFNKVSFVAEPQSNLIHADRMRENASSFVASRVYNGQEFLASTDSWSRPVMMYIGPDGALYVLDYYRQIIEHPEWLSDSVINSGALYNGHDKGRIYRISPLSAPKMNWCSQLKLDNESTIEWVSHLSSPNIWWRRNAQRLLMAKGDTLTISLSQKLLNEAILPTATVHALWLLEGFHAITSEELQKALRNTEAGVRENAIQIAELHLKSFPQIEKNLIWLQNDANPRVRYQLLCTLGELHDQDAESAKRQILIKDIEDKWVQVAALSSMQGKEFGLLKNIVPVLSSKPTEGKAQFFSICSGVIGFSKRVIDIKYLIELATTHQSKSSDWWQAACLRGLVIAFSEKGIPKTNFSAEQYKLLSMFSSKSSPLVRREAIELLIQMGAPQANTWNLAVAKAKLVAVDERESLDFRIDACKLLGMDKDQRNTSLLDKIISNRVSNDTLIEAALFSLNKLAPKSCCESIVRNWKWLSYPARQSAFQVFLSSDENAKMLLLAIQQKDILPAAINWPFKVDLMNHDNSYIRKKSRELLTEGFGSRDEVVKKYQRSLSLQGDTANGLLVFKKVCASCHNLNDKYGHMFGPDLGTIRSRDATSIMTDILNPNRSIATSYDLCVITKTNGQKVSGIISAQTPTTITISNVGGILSIVSRSDCKMIETSANSAMPVGLEASIDQQQMADLIAFIKKSR